MSRAEYKITPADLLPAAEYEKIRSHERKRLVELKRHRRMEVGPHAMFYFENYDTMWQQIQEMLYIEKGGEAQISGELAAYNPLIPQGRELVATLMFEINDANLRTRVLGQLGGIETQIYLGLDGVRIFATPEGDVARSKPGGRASSVHFLHFRFTAAQVAQFLDSATEAVLGFANPEYGHIAHFPPAVRAALAADFDPL